ncbi:type I phosphomannose isomerase catalytic subunit [Flavobacterium subsaxonicum]|uniref:Phosphohexomutase n=1 Tax=Flavobacterium subsaxonicum WB 4.1-42 = DSM 21790 TaxID=1121898 RepID=A0A0A2MM53_9FLAO|nr:type I phosphomannose isomerase catalytic subunit [Flavobacterium subsaxonicum]KGO93404.1 mannose-6-phosphate isomerase [Flavobacterium subsaxonicum WB 4.1-42 = DSM 21790]
MSIKFYPLVFEPILQDRIWGGTKLKTDLGKNIPTQTTGESWELSAVSGNVSVVREGEYAGKPLTYLLEQFPTEVLGTKVHEQFGAQFPLLFKFLDAREDLSIQVHPNDELAKQRHNSFGKTEMWYVMQADPGSRIIVGFKEKSSPEEYLEKLESKKLIDILNQVEAKKGDVYFLETGTIHAIGAGIVIAEIQQTSDITYRIYDWDRVDANGKGRELHVEQALDAMNYNTTDTKKEYNKDENKSNTMVDCPYFTTNFLPLNGFTEISKNGNSFTVYICTDGEYSIEADNVTYTFKKGDTVLIPAGLTTYSLTGTATLLEIYIS